MAGVDANGQAIHDSYFLPTDISFPFPIGIEAAGVIEEVGGAVTGQRVGDRIAFVSSMQVKGGTWAEYAVVPVAGNTILRAFHSLPAMPTCCRSAQR